MGSKLLDTDDILIREYEKIVDLFISEGRAAWELISIWGVIQVGLISGFILFYTSIPASIQGNNLGDIRYLIFSFAGVGSNFLWFFMQCRSKMWRENWLLAGLKLERQLRIGERIIDNGNCYSIFEVERLVTKKKQTLELSEDPCTHQQEIRYRDQKWREKIGALKLAHWSMVLLGIGWTGFAIYIIVLLIRVA